MYRMFFIHSSVNLGCFHVLAIMNGTAMNTGMHISFQMKILSKYICPGVLDHVVVLFLLFKGTSILFFLVAAPIHSPTNSIGGFSFLHTLSSICYSLHFFSFPFLVHSFIKPSPHPLLLPLSPVHVPHCATILCPCFSLHGHCLIHVHSFPLNYVFTEILARLISAFLFSPLCDLHR